MVRVIRKVHGVYAAVGHDVAYGVHAHKHDVTVGYIHDYARRAVLKLYPVAYFKWLLQAYHKPGDNVLYNVLRGKGHDRADDRGASQHGLPHRRGAVESR